MNLISCNKCGAVFDKDKIIFPDVYDHGTQELIADNAEWRTMKRYKSPKVAKEKCGHCSRAIAAWNAINL